MAHMAKFCCYRGFMGHTSSECMKRGTALTQEDTGDIRDMKNERASIKKSLGNVEELGGTVDRMDGQLASLIKWQQEIITPALHTAKEVEKSVTSLQHDISNMNT